MHSATSGRVSALARLWRGSSLRSLQRVLRVSSIRRSWPAFFFVWLPRFCCVCDALDHLWAARDRDERRGSVTSVRVGPCLVWPYSVRSEGVRIGGCHGGPCHGMAAIVWLYSVRSLAEHGSARDADETVSCIRGTNAGRFAERVARPRAPPRRGAGARAVLFRVSYLSRPQSCPLCPLSFVMTEAALFKPQCVEYVFKCEVQT